jgi:hypothetical protein
VNYLSVPSAGIIRIRYPESISVDVSNEISGNGSQAFCLPLSSNAIEFGQSPTRTHELPEQNYLSTEYKVRHPQRQADFIEGLKTVL